jgi:hypothetical protein
MERDHYFCCSPTPLATIGDYLHTQKQKYIDRYYQGDYFLLPIYQQYGKFVMPMHTTALDTNRGVCIYSPNPEISYPHAYAEGHQRALAVCGYQDCVDIVEEWSGQNVWDIRQFQTCKIWDDRRGKKANEVLGFFDYRRVLIEYVLQLASFTARQVGGVDFVSLNLFDYHFNDEAYRMAQEISRTEKPNAHFIAEAQRTLFGQRCDEAMNMGFTHKLYNLGPNDEELVYAMAMHVDEIQPNSAVQSNMGILNTITGQEYGR